MVVGRCVLFVVCWLLIVYRLVVCCCVVLVVLVCGVRRFGVRRFVFVLVC